MNTLFFLILSAFLEIAGCWQYYQYFMVGRSGRWLVSGTVTLMCFARACTQPVLPSAVYIYAGYAGIYAAVAILIRMPLVDREVLTIPIMIGASCYLIGSIAILWPYMRGL